MIQRGEDLRFALEAGEAIGIAGEGIRQNLERDVAIQLRIARAIHLAHAAGAKGREDFVRAEAGAWSEGQRLVDYIGGTTARTDEDCARKCSLAARRNGARTVTWSDAQRRDIERGWVEA